MPGPDPPGASASESTPLLPKGNSKRSSKGKGKDKENPAAQPRPASPPPASPIQHAATEPAEAPPKLPKTDTQGSGWGDPVGDSERAASDERLAMFRRALGINAGLPTDDGSRSGPTLEEGRRTATGIYRQVLREQRAKAIQHHILAALLYACHFAQIIIGAVLTALGPSAAAHSVAITLLGAANTVVAGVLALIKGQGLPERLRHDEVEFRRIQDWIEETEALIAAGVVGRDRHEVGRLVELAFKKYNAAKASEENNKPDAYVRQRLEGPMPSPPVEPLRQERFRFGRDAENAATKGHGRSASAESAPALLLDGDAYSDDDRSHGSGNAIVRLNLPPSR